MKQWLQLLAVILALAWVPITSHCAWENTVGLEFLQCAEEGAQPLHNSQPDDCADDACAELENAGYKISDTSTPVPAPSLTVLFQLLLADMSASQQPSSVTASPPDLPPRWAFLQRTALPPRAPSAA